MHSAPVNPSSRVGRDWVAAAALAVIALLTFAPAVRLGFVNFDDPFYVTSNPNVTAGLSLAGFRWAFTTFTSSNWHPLTWLSLQLDASLWGPAAWGFHLTNVLIHAANAALLFLAVRALTGSYWRSAAVALLFAVHPLRVESVAWVSERKDVLCTSFGLLGLWAYAVYVATPSRWRYLLVALAFALSLLAKAMWVTLPCLFLVLDWWPLRRAQLPRDWLKLAAEKVPLLALAVGCSIVTYFAQSSDGSVGKLEHFPLEVRVKNAAVSYVVYIAKSAWPADLAVYYPHRGADLSDWQAAGSATLVVALTVAAVALRRKAPYLLAGWLWYLGTLVPVIGLVQVGTQGYADRYTYLPQIGLLIAACWGAADLARGHARLALAAVATVAVALCVFTERQLPVWRDSVSLWEHSLTAAGPNALAQFNLAEALQLEGRWPEAARYYGDAVRSIPKSLQPRLRLSAALEQLGKLDEAARQLQIACQMDPTTALNHARLGHLYFQLRRLDEAAREQQEALRLDPELTAVYCDLGNVETLRGRPDRAVSYFEGALRRQPDWAEAHFGLGVALLQQKKEDEAIARLREAARLDPRDGRPHHFLGELLAARGETEAAAAHFQEALRINPQPAVDWYDLGTVRLRQNRPAEAVQSFEEAVKREPDSATYRKALEAARRVRLPNGAAPGAP
jgi:tetratricopeptide (TPR) repeat protein